MAATVLGGRPAAALTTLHRLLTVMDTWAT
jgi:hypothetical protein